MMTRGFLYYLIVILWALALLGNWFGFYHGDAVRYVNSVSDAVLIVLFLLIGYDVYGPPLRGGAARAPGA